MSIGGVAQLFEQEQQITRENRRILEQILDLVLVMNDKDEQERSSLIGYYTIQEVTDISLKSVTTIYREIKNDAFPKQVKLGQKSSGWCKKEILAWLTINTNKGYDYISEKGWSNIYTERYGLKN